MMKYLYDPPYLVKKIISDYQWNSKIDKVLITFDDGPNPKTTELILKLLNGYSIKALFFCVGENIKKYSSLIQEIISEGHEIGNHTFNHNNLLKLKRSEVFNSIKKVQLIAEENHNYKINYFRPPYGKFYFGLQSILNNLKLQNVMWSLLTYDYKNDLNIVKFAIEKYLKVNSIIVLHDSLKSKNIINDSIQKIIETCINKNYQIGSPQECLKYYS